MKKVILVMTVSKSTQKAEIDGIQEMPLWTRLCKNMSAGELLA
jgi:hypothetical protein